MIRFLVLITQSLENIYDLRIIKGHSKKTNIIMVNNRTFNLGAKAETINNTDYNYNFIFILINN